MAALTAPFVIDKDALGSFDALLEVTNRLIQLKPAFWSRRCTRPPLTSSVTVCFSSPDEQKKVLAPIVHLVNRGKIPRLQDLALFNANECPVPPDEIIRASVQQGRIPGTGDEERATLNIVRQTYQQLGDGVIPMFLVVGAADAPRHVVTTCVLSLGVMPLALGKELKEAMATGALPLKPVPGRALRDQSIVHMLEALFSSTRCASCHREETKKWCTACGTTYYCNRECQVAHWSVHKGQCKALRCASMWLSLEDTAA